MAGPSGSTAAPAPQDARALTRRILALAVPAFGALIAEPLFLLADTAIIGHLGTAQLAGVGIGTTILHTLTGLMIFLAYATNSALMALTVGDAAAVDALADRAIELGAAEVPLPEDLREEMADSGMHSREIVDPDGHQWEFVTA